MASIGEVIYEDYLYKFTGASRSILWGKANPWREKYFILKRIGNKPILEQYNKKPKNKTAVPKGKIELWPTYRVEKITNMKNRAYVFQLTTPQLTVCLSADDQRNMDMFVFFLQVQSRLKDQLREDVFRIDPEHSESHRRIGARGSNCILHVSPYGITLALESNRAVLAQWPLKSIRSYESSERGQLCLESGRIAPMGDGLYVFNTIYNGDNQIFDILDKYVMDNLDKVQTIQMSTHNIGFREIIRKLSSVWSYHADGGMADGLYVFNTIYNGDNQIFDILHNVVDNLDKVQPGNTQDLEDYVWEAERLLGLTVVSACTLDNPDVRNIVNTNWNTDLQPLSGSRPRPVIHTRLTGAQSTTSLNSQNSISSPHSVPNRLGGDNTAGNSPHIPRSLPSYQNSPLLDSSRRGSNQSQTNIATRPPLPPPSGSIPVKVPSQSQRREQYISMDSTSSTSGRSDKMSIPSSPFSPTSADWAPPPNFRDAMRQKSTTPISEHGQYNQEAYLLPSPGATSTPNKNNQFENYGDQYLTPMSPTSEEVNNNHNRVRLKSKSTKQTHSEERSGVTSERRLNYSQSTRRRRLRSMSCEDLSDYLRHIVYDPVSKSMSDLLDDGESEAEDQAPDLFPRLDTYSSMDLQFPRENYYNIEGLQGKVYDAPMLSVGEMRKRFSKKSQVRIRRSMSNPNFMRIMNKEKLHSARVSAGITGKKQGSRSSLVNLLPDSLKKHLSLSREGVHRGSNTTLSSGAASPHSHGSSRASSTHTSPSNSLSRKSGAREDIVSGTGVKGINITKRTRSFRKQKLVDEHQKTTVDEQQTSTKSKQESELSNREEIGVDDKTNATDTYHIMNMVKRDNAVDSGVSPTNTDSESKQLNGKGAVGSLNKKGPPKVAQKPVLKLDVSQREATTMV